MKGLLGTVVAAAAASVTVAMEAAPALVAVAMEVAVMVVATKDMVLAGGRPSKKC
jgi:hypothetical protein